MYLEDILQKLNGVKKDKDGYIAICPAHNDHNPSLHVAEGRSKDRTVLYCHAGCSQTEVVESLGLSFSDLFYPTAEYNYGNTTHKRMVKKGDGGKTFPWTNGNPTQLYNAENIKGDEIVFFTEGEKDANTLIELGFIATTDGGTTSSDYSVLANKKVAILQDNDEAGKSKSARLYERLNKLVDEVRIITPEIGGWSHIEKGDCSDIELSMSDVEQWWDKAKKSKGWMLGGYTQSQLLNMKLSEPRWIIPHIIPVGLTILAGRPKAGKSYLALQIANEIADGGSIFNTSVDEGKVLFLAYEDSKSRLAKRTKEQGYGETENIMYFNEWPKLNNGGSDSLEEAIKDEKFKLVVIDTLSRSAIFKQNEVEPVTELMGNLQKIALDNDCAIMVLDHHNKPSGDASDIIRDVLGSTGKTAVADTIIGFYRNQSEKSAQLKAEGRDIEFIDYMLKQNGYKWELLGDTDTVILNENEKMIYEALETYGTQTHTGLFHLTNINKGTLTKVLTRMESNHRIIKENNKYYSILGVTPF